MSLKEDQEELKTGEKKSNTVKMNDDDEDDDEKTKTSFRLGEGISPRDTLAVQGTVPVLEQLKQTCKYKESKTDMVLMILNKLRNFKKIL